MLKSEISTGKSHAPSFSFAGKQCIERMIPILVTGRIEVGRSRNTHLSADAYRRHYERDANRHVLDRFESGFTLRPFIIHGTLWHNWVKSYVERSKVVDLTKHFPFQIFDPKVFHNNLRSS